MDFIGALNSTKKIVEYVFQLKGVSEESRNAKAHLDRVQSDLNQLKRLANELNNFIPPDRRRDIDDIICETNEVITLMATPNRRSRKDVKEHGTVTIWRRITWTMRDGGTIQMYMNRLLTCHTSLQGHLVPLRTMQVSNGRGSHGLRSKVWEDVSTLESGSAIVTEDLNDEDLWKDWLSDGDGKQERERECLSAGRQSHRGHDNHGSSPPRETEQKEDLLWLSEHTETELRGRGHMVDNPIVSEPPGDISWLADLFNNAEEDDRARRSASRH